MAAEPGRVLGLAELMYLPDGYLQCEVGPAGVLCSYWFTSGCNISHLHYVAASIFCCNISVILLSGVLTLYVYALFR